MRVGDRELVLNGEAVDVACIALHSAEETEQKIRARGRERGEGRIVNV